MGRGIRSRPSIYLGFLVLAVVSAAASGGGREIVPREQGVAWPVSSMTDHFGALLLAPLNIAWLLQALTLLGTTAYVAGRPATLWATELPVLLYLVLATALGAVVAWLLEWVRRGPHGAVVVRSLLGVLSVSLVALVLTHHLTDVLDQSPTVWVFVAATVGCVLLGALPARLAAGRAPREEHRLESGIYQPRADALATCAPWCASTGPASGARCRCAEAWSCSP